jgi:radical SAM-linked protein
MIIRAKYTKTGTMVYLSHLDLVRLFERAFRRISLPMAFTQGYNQHPLISFAAPLSLGVSSSAEYLEVVLSEAMDPNEFINKMNGTLPEEIQIKEAVLKTDKQPKSLMHEVALVDYNVTLTAENMTAAELEQSLTDFLGRETLIIEKKAKPSKNRGRSGPKKTKQIDLKTFIHQMSLSWNENNHFEIRLKILVFDHGTVKPSVVMKEWLLHAQIPVQPEDLEIERTEIYKLNQQGAFIPMLREQ